MAKKLTKLKIAEVSLCERGANPGAMVTLFKRDAPTEIEAHRDDDPNFGATGRGPMHDELFTRYDNLRRQKSPAQGGTAFQEAWASLSDDERDQIRSEEEATERARAALAEARQAAAQREHGMSKTETTVAEMVKLAHGVVRTGVENTIRKSSWHSALREMAAERQEDGESIHQSVARLVQTDRDALALFKAAVSGTADDEAPSPVPAPVIKANPANDQIRALASELQKADPGLTRLDALMKVHNAHPALAARAKAA